MVIFTLISFSVLALIAMITVLNLPKKKDIYYLLFGFLFLISVFTIRNYIYPKHLVYHNTDYHILEHLGFEFADTLVLANSQNPKTALWDSEEGSINIHSFQNDFEVQIKDNYLPVYIQDKDFENSSLSRKTYHLANKIADLPITDSLKIVINDSLTLALGIKETLKDRSKLGKFKQRLPFTSTLNKDTATYTVSFYKNETLVHHSKSKFTTRLSVGYPISDIINKSKIMAESEMPFLLDILDSVYLTREKHITDTDIFNDSPFFLSPTQKFLDSIQTISNGTNQITQRDLNTNHQLLLKSKQKFYTGVGLSKSRVYRIVKNKPNNQLLYEFSDKKHLKELDNREEALFMTSSSEEVAQSELLAGYYYPLLKEKDSYNHFYAGLKYYKGNARNKMLFRVIPYDQDIQTPNEAQNFIYEANVDTIKIPSIGYTDLKTNKYKSYLTWLYKVQDMRDSNPLQYHHIVFLLVLMILFTYLLIAITPLEQLKRTEILIYIALFSFIVIRGVLLWRMATFIPIEDINIKVYEKLRASSQFLFLPKTSLYFKETGMMVALFYGLLLVVRFCSIKKIQFDFVDKIQERLITINTSNTTDKTWLWFLFYSIPVIAKAIPELERFANIFIPVLTYFAIDWLLIQRKANAGKSEEGFSFYRKVNWFICFGFLAMFDAGFGSIFLLYGLLYQFVRSLLNNNQKRNRKNPKKSYRFFVWIGALVVLLYCSNYLLLFLFDQPRLSVILISIGIMGFGGYQFFKNSARKVDDQFRKIYLSAAVIACVFGLMLLVFQNKAIDVIEGKSYVKYRTAIHVKNVDDIMIEEEFNSPNSNRLLQAAQNQWYIAYHYDDNLLYKSAFWKNLWSGKYFKLTPHFKKGASYMAQTTDLVAVRYVISEHSEWLIFFILIIWFLLSYGIIARSNIKLDLNELPIKASLLFFTIAFFIWMAATNRFIFFGQDFPLISLTSRLAMIFPLTIFILSILIVKEGNDRQRNLPKINQYYSTAVFTLMFSIWLLNNKYQGTDNFNILETMEDSQKEFNDLNDDFLAYQESIGLDTLNKISNTTLISNFSDKYNVDRTLNSPFSQSIFNIFKNELVERNSPGNILHLRRPEGQYFQFAMNNNYYRLKSPDVDLNAWKGSLMASRPSITQQFIYRANKRTHPIQVENKGVVGQFVSNSYSDKNKRIVADARNVRMTIIPGGWTQNGEPVVIISKTQGQMANTKYQFSIAHNEEYINSQADNNFAYNIQNNDAIRIIDAKGNYIKLKYTTEDKQFLAKNIWLNGKQQLFYPLGEKFMWAYNYASLLKNNFQGDEDLYTNVSTSIDFDLTEDIYDLAKQRLGKNQFKNQDKERAKAFSLVALDGEGRIKLLSDFKKGIKNPINPNNIDAYNEELNKFYLESSTVTERLLFGNKCLLHINNGPGSSIKPIVYSAVTSRYNLGWEKLKLNAPTQQILNEVAIGQGRSTLLKYYGGKSIGHWRMLYGHNLDATYNNKQYIKYSSNSYHSLIVFLGSYDKPTLENTKRYLSGSVNSDFVLAKGYSSKVKENFPMIGYNGKAYRFNNWAKDFSITSSLLAEGLWLNYNLPVVSDQIQTDKIFNYTDIYPELSNDYFKTTKSMHKLWSFPEISQFLQVDRKSNPFVNGLRQSTVGGYPINVTPLKMAEMGARMTSLNSNYKITLNPNEVKNEKELFEFDASWSTEEALKFHSNELFEGMHQVVHGAGGTGGILRKVANKNKDYHFYAKTGTINSDFPGIDNRHFMVIISKEKLHSNQLTEEDFKNNKYYVLYFSFFTHAGSNWGMIDDVVEKVLDSHTFKTYMNE